MLNDATLYERFKQRIYIMLNDALIQVTGYKTISFESLYHELSPACPKQNTW